MGIPNDILIIVGLVLLSVFFLMAVFARLYRKAGPVGEAAHRYWLSQNTNRKGKRHGDLPHGRKRTAAFTGADVVQHGAEQQDLYTKRTVAVTVEAVAQIKVKSDPESIVTAAPSSS